MSQKFYLSLHPKQEIAYGSAATEILYGGSAGGGKSHLMRVAAVAWCIAIPGLQVYLFRRIREDLVKNHLEGPNGFRVMLAPFIGIINIIDDEIRFPNGSRIYLCHCKDEKDRFKYQGAEIHVLLIDELTHFTDLIYRFLRSRVRLPNTMKGPQSYVGKFPRILCSSNPGGIGHQWVRAAWIDPKPAFECWRTPDSEAGFLRQYIPARLEDNPSLDRKSYTSTLSGLGSDELVRAMLDGDWDVVAGAALDISRERHMLRPFTPPKHWTRFQVLDWGYVKPFSVGWYCVVEGVTQLKAKGHWPEMWLPDGAIVRYREYYGSDKKANEGIRMESPELACKVIDTESLAEERMDYRVADTQIWAKNDGTSIMERMFKATKGKFNPRKSEKDRQASYIEVCTRLKGEEQEGGTYAPMFYATENCVHFWRTVPPLVLDELHPERGPGENQENHVWDELCYALMSRPYIRTEQQRITHEFKSKRQKFNVDNDEDPYRMKRVKK